MIIKGYRYSVTGATGYDFYDPEDNHVCGSSYLSLPFSSVNLGGWRLSWESQFDLQTTIVPGIARTVVESEKGKLVASIVYRDAGIYDILYRGETVRAQMVQNQYLFLRDNEPIALCRRFDRPPARREKFPGVPAELRFAVALPDGMSPAWKLLVLTFPNLQFFL